LLVYRQRNRVSLFAAGAVAVVQGAMLALAIGDTSHPLLGWIKSIPLSLRIKQVPVDFGLGELYRSSLVAHGLLGAAILGAVVVALLVFAGGPSERRGAVFSGGLAACVVLTPIVLAQFGSDYVVARNLMPAWIPLAVVLAAACTVPRARVAGAALAVVLLVSFVYAGVRISNHPEFQRPDWRGVARALGPAADTRAIIAYDGSAATEPLALYMRGIPWPPGSGRPVGVSEIDVVGSTFQAPPSRLPSGIKLISTTPVHGLLVARFSVAPALRATPAAIAAGAGSLLEPALSQPSVLIQRTTP
jgi:hypothetical protein